MQAIIRLESITGIPGFPARSLIKVGDDVQPKDGEWHDAAEKGWRWKGDTSSDEIVGHYFAYAIYYDLVADADEKKQLRAALDRITTHILDHGYQLIDVDGQRTRWGWWGPEAIWAGARRDGSASAAHPFALASRHASRREHSGGDEVPPAYDDLIKTHRYHLLTRNHCLSHELLEGEAR